MGAAAPLDDLLDRLKNWLHRLVIALTKIVTKLTSATSFSVSVGRNVCVAVTFGP